MAPFPLPLQALLGKAGMYAVFLLIGFGFGYVLEISGFNDSPRLAAQFYFKDLRVLKVMFTAIIVAMILTFAASGIGLLDYNLIWVNPTYLWSGIVGGIIMGFGFIVGGFCPGTSLVAASTLKIDGLIFVLGGLIGVTLFGETERFFPVFYNGSYFGRVTLMEFFGLPTGVVVLIVVLMALFMFWGGEQLERIIGKKDLSKESKYRYVGAGGILLAALVVLVIGQPTNADRWEKLSVEKGPQLEKREFHIHPGELLATMHDPKINLIMLDVRSEGDYNLFHILDSDHMPLDEIPGMIDGFHLEPANTVFVVMSNDDTAATEVWKFMVAESVPNVYILNGGINNWLDTFAGEFEGDFCAGKKPAAVEDELNYDFTAALGAGCPAAYPDVEEFEVEYEAKIKLELKRAPSGGGCG
jgi:rhodanese-related sulfurtransferase